ncbi:MAG: TIGR04282 family arsenosugar biosynthesis glycosyltransferase [Oleiphilaceae bacterium]|nr:TIGR04282 family arsenosugar biosynthesis glycosyltransferase [Oleiphilaceae bacterium]
MIPDTDAPGSTLLIQFAKWPERGRVKTRLAAALGEQGALEAHIALTRAVLGQLRATGLPVAFWWDRPLATPPPEASSVLAELSAGEVAQGYQQGADLGERMSRALSRGLEDHAQVIIIGSDCPSVDPEYIAAARLALMQQDLVMGPSDDGGYVLIGARRTTPSMLSDIEWGTPGVLAQTRQRLSDCGLSHGVLEPRWDVDEPADWERFLRWRAERAVDES